MAEISRRLVFNQPGKYFVDAGCICCGICTRIAPAIFKVNLIEEVGFVGKQPETKAEIEALLRAVIACPVDAIGEDRKERTL